MKWRMGCFKAASVEIFYPDWNVSQWCFWMHKQWEERPRAAPAVAQMRHSVSYPSPVQILKCQSCSDGKWSGHCDCASKGANGKNGDDIKSMGKKGSFDPLRMITGITANLLYWDSLFFKTNPFILFITWALPNRNRLQIKAMQSGLKVLPKSHFC